MRLNTLVLSLAICMHPLASGSGFLDEEQSYVSENSLGFNDGLYIVPNEHEFYLFQSSLTGRTGALIAVGTFRALEAASRGHFSRLVMMDVDPGVVAFNRLQVQALVAADTRGMFLAHLLGLPELAPAFDRLLESHQLKGQLRSLVDDETLFAQHPFHEHVLIYVEKLLDYQTHQIADYRSFLASPIRFARVRDLARRHKIEVVRADLGGQVLRHIAWQLRDENTPVDILDVSNAPHYFLSRRWFVSRTLRAYLENLEALPFAENAQINFTSPISQGSRRKSYFEYHSIPVLDYQRALARISANPRAYTYDLYVSSIERAGRECERHLDFQKPAGE